MYFSFWINLNSFTEKEIHDNITLLSDIGIDEIIAIGSDEKWEAAQGKCLESGINMQSWKMIMIENNPEILKNHADWYTINRNGISSADFPSYVGYYHWLCPNKEEARQYLEGEIDKLCNRKNNDAIHLDYIRYSDVILPVKCQKQYNIVQKEELPEYDYCYCETCREKFRKEYGYDIMEKENPQDDVNWKKFRLDSITNVVAMLKKLVHNRGKRVTAAVFPTPDIAIKLVRQDWTSWDLDAFYPMIYHDFYEQPAAWIKDAYRECIKDTNSPVHAGIYLPAFKNGELESTLLDLIENKVDKISFFSFNSNSNEVFKIIKKIRRNKC